MVRFKKDKDNNKLKELKGYIITFMSDSIIAVFFVLFILLMVVNNTNNDRATSSSTSISEPISIDDDPS